MKNKILAALTPTIVIVFLTTIFILSCPSSVHGQTVSAGTEMVTITIPRNKFESDESLQQSAEFQSQKEKIELYGKWVGLGNEVGNAVNSSLSAITTQTANFAGTTVGKVTMALVIWKVVGDDLSGYVLGLLWLIVFLPLWVWSYRTTRSRNIRDTEVIEGNRRTITYKFHEATSSEEFAWVIHMFALIIIIVGFCVFVA